MSRVKVALIFAITLSATAISEGIQAEETSMYSLTNVGFAPSSDNIFNSRRMSALNKAWKLYLTRNELVLSEIDKARVQTWIIQTSYVANDQGEKVLTKTSALIRESALALKQELNREIAAQRNVHEAKRNIDYLDKQLLPNLNNRAYFLGVAPVYFQPAAIAH